jgi:hypothetical protein
MAKKFALTGLGIGAALLLALGTPQASADQPVCYSGSGGGTACAFYSPSHKINCEIHYQVVTGTGSRTPDDVYCENASQSVNMDAAGELKTCNDVGCVGNPGIGTATLAYGQTAAVGPFSCLSQPTGVTCTVTSGRGFTISSSGITPV